MIESNIQKADCLRFAASDVRYWFRVLREMASKICEICGYIKTQPNVY